MKNVAIVRFTDSEILPVQVEFPKSIGNYKSLELALVDIKFFNCTPCFSK